MDIKIYSNQQKASNEIVEKFLNGNHYVILKAEMQEGKTGTILGVLRTLERNDGELSQQLGINKFSYLIGENQDVKQQTQDDYEELFDYKNTYLKSDFRKNSDMRGKKLFNTKEIKNALIFIDESHFGTKNDFNVLPNYLQLLGINHMKATEELKERNIYVVSVSATPWIEIISDTEFKKEIVNLPTSTTYIGVKKFIQEGIVKPLDTNVLKDEGKTYSFIEDEIYKYLKKIKKEEGFYRTAIIRIPTTRDSCKFDWKDTFSKHFNIIQYSGKNINSDGLFYKILSNDNKKPLLVVIKGTFRMGKRIPDNIKDRIGVVYDWSNGRLETTAQGLLGRMCGHISNREKNSWKKTLLYISTNHYESLYKYYVEGKYLTPQECFICDKTEKKGYHPIVSVNVDTVKSVEMGYEQVDKMFGSNEWYEFLTNGKRKKNSELEYIFTTIGKNIIENYSKEQNLGRRVVITNKNIKNDNRFIDFEINYTKGHKPKYSKENVESGKLFYPMVIDISNKDKVIIYYQPKRMIYNTENEDQWIDKNIKMRLSNFVVPTMYTGNTKS